MPDLQRPADGRDMDAHPHGIPDMGDILDLALSAAQNWTRRRAWFQLIATGAPASIRVCARPFQMLASTISLRSIRL
jgi:hypothetical protein